MEDGVFECLLRVFVFPLIAQPCATQAHSLRVNAPWPGPSTARVELPAQASRHVDPLLPRLASSASPPQGARVCGLTSALLREPGAGFWTQEHWKEALGAGSRLMLGRHCAGRTSQPALQAQEEQAGHQLQQEQGQHCQAGQRAGPHPVEGIWKRAQAHSVGGSAGSTAPPTPPVGRSGGSTGPPRGRDLEESTGPPSGRICREHRPTQREDLQGAQASQLAPRTRLPTPQ